jgi:hypothetical protein
VVKPIRAELFESEFISEYLLLFSKVLLCLADVNWKVSLGSLADCLSIFWIIFNATSSIVVLFNFLTDSFGELFECVL